MSKINQARDLLDRYRALEVQFRDKLGDIRNHFECGDTRQAAREVAGLGDVANAIAELENE